MVLSEWPALPGRKPRRIANTPEIAALVAANMALAHHAARRAWGAGHPRVAFGDVLSEATYALWRCAAAFDPSRGFRFSTFAYKPCLRAARQKFQIDAGRKKAVHTVSPDAPDPRPTHRRPDVLDGLVEAEERAAMLAWLDVELGRLGTRDAEIIRRYVADGQTMQAIGDAIGLTRGRVQQIVEASLDELTRRLRRRRRIELNA